MLYAHTKSISSSVCGPTESFNKSPDTEGGGEQLRAILNVCVPRRGLRLTAADAVLPVVTDSRTDLRFW
ncbi:unnamed protein product [Trichobilharzia regenti]|nr:unnamed protein product [Trichobilharzia regenti]